MANTAQARTPAQNARLWALVGELAKATGSTREEAEPALRRICREISGQEHTSRLSSDQAREVIKLLDREVQGHIVSSAAEEAPLERTPWGPRGPGPRDQVAITPRMVQVLQALYLQAGLDSRQKQMAFCTRQCKVPWPQTHRHYDQIVEALKDMILRQVDPSDAWARVRALRGHRALNTWQIAFMDDLHKQFERAADIGQVLTTHKLAKLVEAEVGVEAWKGGPT